MFFEACIYPRPVRLMDVDSVWLLSVCVCVCTRVTCLHCGANTCRHKMQQQLADLNPQMADRVRQITTAAAAAAGRGAGISNRSAYERALRVGTAADARKVQAGEQAEQVRGCLDTRHTLDTKYL